MLSFRYAWGGGTPGARLLLTEFPIFVLLYARFFSQTKARLSRIILVAISLVFVFWNLLVVGEYMKQVDLEYIVQAPAITARIGVFKETLSTIFSVKDLAIKLKLCSPLAIAFCVALFLALKRFQVPPVSFWHEKNAGHERGHNSFYLFTAALCASYVLITGLNLYNNPKKVAGLKQIGFFENSQLLGLHDVEKQENIGSINEMIKYYGWKQNQEKIRKMEKLKKDVYNE